MCSLCTDIEMLKAGAFLMSFLFATALLLGTVLVV